MRLCGFTGGFYHAAASKSNTVLGRRKSHTDTADQ